MTRARELSKLANDAVFSVDANNNIGVNSTTPDAKFDVVGVVSATTFYGDGSNLSGITAGATLSAGSGSQRVVVTSLTSGTMTAAATDAELTYNSDTDTLSATNFSGALSGNATGLSGTPDITVGSITATGNVSVGGTLTYEDVTNVDSIGVITARSGINVTAGGADLKGVLQEKVNITAGKLSDNTNINLTNGMVHYFTTTETTTSTPNIMSTVGINTEMATGDTIAVTIITTAAAAGYSTSVNIDGNYNDVKWIGGSDPTTGGASGLDIYAFNIIKTGSAAYTVVGNLSNAA